jgi:molybdate transport system ATP-binding protein
VLSADISLRLDRLDLDAGLAVQSGEVVAVLGPNGSGKSTILRALAGLLKLAGGKVELGGTVLEDPSAKIRIPAEKRPVALMFQDYLLFPHLSALENVAFGLRARGVDRREARDRAAQALERLDVGKVAEAKPTAMSGGQQQRVAMARALVTEPKLLLLDEPLAALDVSTKADVRRHLRSVLRAAPKLHGGGELVTANGNAGQVLAVVQPSAVHVHRERPDADSANLWSGGIGAVDLLGDRVRVRVDSTPSITAEVLPHDVDRLKLDDGGRLWASFPAEAASVYPP